MNIPCDRRIDCPGDDSPIRNYSAEGPDSRLFCRTGFYQGIPKIGECWERTGCSQIACSLESTEQAELEAYQAASECVWSTWSTPSCPPDPNGIPPTQPPPEEPTREPIEIYRNTRQTCSSTCPDGTPFTYTIPAGRYSAQSQAEANAMAYSEACRQAQFHLLCVNSPTSPTCADQPYVSVLTASGAYSGTGGAWSFVSGSLPAGLTFAGGTSPTTIISGTPTAPGVYTFTVRYSLTNGDYIQKDTGIRVLEITTTSLPDADGSPYSETLTEVGGEITSWAVVSGSLPPGLTLTGDTISGTATTDGVYPFTIGLYDSGALVCTKDLSITVSSCVEEFKIDWTPSGYDLENNSVLNFSYTDSVTEITSDQVAIVWDNSNNYIDGVGIWYMDGLVSLKYNSLLHCSTAFGIVVASCPVLSTIEFNSLIDSDYISIQSTACTSLALPSLTTCPAIAIASNPSLSALTIASFSPTDGGYYDFTANALSQASIDHILGIMVANPAFLSGSVLLDGGTNSTPSAAGLVNVGILTGRGVAVTNN